MAWRLDIRYQVYFYAIVWDRSLAHWRRHLSRNQYKLGLKKSWISCNINLVALLLSLDVMHLGISCDIVFPLLSATYLVFISHV